MKTSIRKGYDMRNEYGVVKTYGIHIGAHENKIEIHGNEQLRDFIMYSLEGALESEELQEILKQSEEAGNFIFNNK